MGSIEALKLAGVHDQNVRDEPRCAVCDALNADRTQILLGPAEGICDVCVNRANLAQESVDGEIDAAESIRDEAPPTADAATSDATTSDAIKGPRDPGATPACTFCGESRHRIAFVFEEDRHICRSCLDLFNQVLFEAVGREALAENVRSQVERDYRRRIRETDRLELDLMNRRSRSIQQELLSYNLELLLRNVDGILESSQALEHGFKYLPYPLRRRAITRLQELSEALAASLPEAVRPAPREE